MKLLPILLFLIALPVYAGDRHHHKPEPTPINVPDEGSNHNALILAAIVAMGVCVYHQCWKPKPVKVTGSSVPEIPKNEFTYTIKP
ncbi:MAG TPA: hypothetical protein VJ742_08530 [Nitrososphaera sp.]|nr:hypothetical protein [Nitrososphaera sp.]